MYHIQYIALHYNTHQSLLLTLFLFLLLLLIWPSNFVLCLLFSATALLPVLVPSSGELQITKEILLQYNQLTGLIPNVLITGLSLQIFNARQNHISGTIPSNVGLYGNLTSVDVVNNNLYGTIPASIGCLAIIALLDLASNSFRYVW